MEHENRRPDGEQASRYHASKQHKSTRRRTGRSVGFVLLTVFLIGVCTAAMIAGIFMTYVKTTLAPTLEVKAEDYTASLSRSSVVYYQDKESGEWVEYQKLYGVENRIWADYDQMPDALWQAAVAIEDHRFFDHKGVDWRRTIGATVNMFIGMKNTFGGSTLTQQTLKNMTGDDRGTVNRKVREIFRALEFEKDYTKQQILELYLNYIYLGQSCYGVQTAANFYFGKDVSELSVAESACLIAITNNPYMYSPFSSLVITRDDGTKVTARELNKQRQEMILDRMAGKDTGLTYLTQEEADAAKAEVLHFTDGTTSAEDIVKASNGVKVNNWFVELVYQDVAEDLAAKENISVDAAMSRINNGGFKIYTTMDPKIQEIAESVYGDRSNLDVTSSGGQQLQSGITIIDPYTGDIVATVGAVGEKEGNRVWNYATSRRQPGSAIKPLTVYAPALENNAITMASTFDNYPVRLLNNRPWPKNSPNTYTGWTTLEEGVRRSINTVAVQVVEKVGIPAAYKFATENLHLGLVPDDENTAAIGLGGLTHGLNTVEMAAAYAAFANGGVYHEPRTYLRVTADEDKTVILENEGVEHAAMKETTAYFMNTLLQGVVNGGTGYSAKFDGMAIGGKTGTTSDNYDRYFVGYTPYYSAAVWTGYGQPEKIRYNGNPAITMWKKVMQKIHEELPNKSFPKPTSGLETVEVCADSGLRCCDGCRADVRGQSRARQVTVAAGTAPTETCNLHQMVSYCKDGKCLAGEFCPAESVTMVGALNYVREVYEPPVAAEDDPYLIANMQKVVEETGCPVHGAAQRPVNPDAPGVVDPDDPDGGTGEKPGGEPTIPVEPSEPQEPTVPPEEDPSGGFGDEGWVLIG